jgi:hypothetical protein
MIALEGLVATVYAAITLLVIALIIYIIVGVLVLLKRRKVVTALYFSITPLLFLIGYTLTHNLKNPDYIFISSIAIILFNSFFLLGTKRYQKKKIITH